ncbi:hypothetical protein SARC_05447 [Sphaeroforma arctica JP610]|uniref:Plus3 domain-containing protein n=1 Tax=Sphaeroforma arctica JP610 TaxID=667725 RepID=A0A0L0FZM5_9EUKA|nr:hypothetical protein SARC_05447 [Sphaeroforma arctica JP610]KNC82275.1 hypothetical protein SARC_05447 [Sphaeroforma arctica JP610]|eukprot:XP_014156177.1 hypothetical protein SARC_05447 [Sphaeroforma arctica JP610]
MSGRQKRQVSDTDDSGSDSRGSAPQSKRAKSLKQIFSDSDSGSDWNDSPSRPAANRRSRSRSRSHGRSRSESDSSLSDSDSELSDGGNGIYKDEKERQMVDAMTELQREVWIVERTDENEKKKARQKIERKMRKSRRQKDREQRRREEGSSRRSRSPESARKQAPKPRVSSKPEAWTSEEESDSGSDDDHRRSSRGDKGSARKRDASPEPEVTVEHLNSIKLSRHKVTKWHNLPEFPELVVGCFVRASIGTANGRSVYRAVEVLDMTKMKGSKSYTLGGHPCNQLLTCAFGVNKRDFYLKYVSDGLITDQEFSQLKAQLEKDGKKLPSMKTIKAKTQQIEDMLNKKVTTADIEYVLKQKKDQSRHRLDIQRTYASEKIRMETEKAVAQQEGDEKEVERIDKLLDGLEAKANTDRMAFKNRKTIAAMAHINERARVHNTFQRDTKTPLDKSLEDGMKYMRVKTRPVMLTAIDRERILAERAERDAIAANGTADTAEARAEKERVENEAERKRRQSLDVSDLKTLHGFDLDLGSRIDELCAKYVFVVPERPDSDDEDTPVDRIALRARRLSEFKKRKGLT